MKLSILPVLTLATPLLAIPADIVGRTTTPGVETPCAQINGVKACCADNQKQKANSPAVLDALAADPRLAGVIGLLGSLPLIGGLLIPVTTQVGVAQQCK